MRHLTEQEIYERTRAEIELNGETMFEIYFYEPSEIKADVEPIGDWCFDYEMHNAINDLYRDHYRVVDFKGVDENGIRYGGFKAGR